MSGEDAAIEALDRALRRLERALERLSNRANGEALEALEVENRRLSDALGAARRRHEELEGRMMDASGRLDGVIGDLKAVLER